jgi:hypothetical protein
MAMATAIMTGAAIAAASATVIAATAA